MIKSFIKSITTANQRAFVRSIIQRGLNFSRRFAGDKNRLKEFEKPYSLHLGSGPVVLEGFCNVDAMASSVVDVVDDIRTLKKFENGCAKEIYACHVLEHFSHDEVPKLLKRWHDVLAPGGQIRISVPDIDRIVRIYHKNFAHFETPGNTPWIGLIYGGQTNEYDFHKTGFNACWLKVLLENAGFELCEEYPHFPHFVAGTFDGSLAQEPFGEYLSLNMKAIKRA